MNQIANVDYNDSMQEFIDTFKEKNNNNIYKADTRTMIWFTNNSVYEYAAICATGYQKGTVICQKVQENITHTTSAYRAEGFAILSALKDVFHYAIRVEWDHLIIYTKEIFWINMFNKHMPGWKGDAVFDSHKNADITKEMWRIYNELRAKHKVIEIKLFNSNKIRDTIAFHMFYSDNNKLAKKLAIIARKLSDFNPKRKRI